MPQPRIFQLLQQAHSALFRSADHALRNHNGLTSSQQAVLFALVLEDGTPISVIADQLSMGRSSLTQLVDRMSEKGLVRRKRNPQDSRSFQLYIEPEGRKAVEETLEGVRGINKALLDPFSKKEQIVIEKFLRHVAGNASDIVSQHVKSPH